MLFILVPLQNLIVVVSIVLMDSPKCEIIKASLSYNAFPHQIRIAVLLDLIVV